MRNFPFNVSELLLAFLVAAVLSTAFGLTQLLRSRKKGIDNNAVARNGAFIEKQLLCIIAAVVFFVGVMIAFWMDPIRAMKVAGLLLLLIVGPALADVVPLGRFAADPPKAKPAAKETKFPRWMIACGIAAMVLALIVAWIVWGTRGASVAALVGMSLAMCSVLQPPVA